MDAPSIELSKFIAKILTVLYTPFGIGMLFNGSHYKREIQKLLDNFAFLITDGMVSLLVGFLIVLYHNVFEKNWRVIITLFGYVALLKGCVITIFPQIAKMYKPIFKIGNIEKIFGIFLLVLGGIFAYLGFFYTMTKTVV